MSFVILCLVSFSGSVESSSDGFVFGQNLADRVVVSGEEVKIISCRLFFSHVDIFVFEACFKWNLMHVEYCPI